MSGKKEEEYKEYTEDILKKKLVSELKKICEENSYKKATRKADLISNILNKVSAKEKVPDKKIKKSHNIELVKNEHGNYEHPDSKIVINNEDIAIGVQLENGTVRVLQEEDIKICQEYQFIYELPNNLGTLRYSEDDENTRQEYLSSLALRLKIEEEIEDDVESGIEKEMGTTLEE